MPDIEEIDFDYDSDQDSPNNQSVELQSSTRPQELENWELSIKKSVSFRHTYHEKLDITSLKNWLQSTFKGGVIAPEKGRSGKLHYQCYILHTDKKEFTPLFDRYKDQNSYNTWTTTDVQGTIVPFKGNKLQCIQDTRDLHKLGSYCLKENKNNLHEVTYWGIPPHILQLYASLSKLKHDTKEIVDKQNQLDESFLLGSLNDHQYIDKYMQIYHDYGKDFRIQKIKDHWVTLKSKIDPTFKYQIITSMTKLGG